MGATASVTKIRANQIMKQGLISETNNSGKQVKNSTDTVLQVLTVKSRIKVKSSTGNIITRSTQIVKFNRRTLKI
jgi:hypothetical protein